MTHHNPYQNPSVVLPVEPGQMVLGFIWMSEQSKQFFKRKKTGRVQPYERKKKNTLQLRLLVQCTVVTGAERDLGHHRAQGQTHV